MATRNFYERQSVSAFLLYALQTGDATAASSAAAELVSSGLASQVEHVATLALLLSPSPSFRPEADRLSAALALRPFDLPTSLPLLPPPTKTVAKACPWTPRRTAKAAAIWWAIRDALNHGRGVRAATVSLVVAEEDRASLLMSFGVAPSWAPLFASFPPDRVFLHAYASLNDSRTTAAPATVSLQDAVGRSFVVDPKALALWNIPSPPMSLCVGAPLWVLEADAAPCWKELVGLHGVHVKGNSLEGRDDEATEAFYCAGFPHDIPDEWSQKERKKSHGMEVWGGVPSVYARWFPRV